MVVASGVPPASVCRSDVSIAAEKKVTRQGGVRYSDIFIHDRVRDRAVVVGLKPIPLCVIDVEKWLGGKVGVTAVKDFLRGKASSLRLSDDDLMGLPLVVGYGPHKVVTERGPVDLVVQDVMDGAVQQLREQVYLYQDVGTLSVFVLLQVHRRCVVHRVGIPKDC